MRINSYVWPASASDEPFQLPLFVSLMAHTHRNTHTTNLSNNKFSNFYERLNKCKSYLCYQWPEEDLISSGHGPFYSACVYVCSFVSGFCLLIIISFSSHMFDLVHAGMLLAKQRKEGRQEGRTEGQTYFEREFERMFVLLAKLFCFCFFRWIFVVQTGFFLVLFGFFAFHCFLLTDRGWKR